MIDVDELLSEATTLPPEWELHGATRRALTPASQHDTSAELLDRAEALAERLPPSVEGHGGDEALFVAARELSTVLGEDAEAIAFVLEEVFNPRCLPPWPAPKLRREASRAADSQATPQARMARRKATSEAETPPRDDRPLDPFEDSLTDWSRPEPPFRWYCEGLGIAASERKVTLIGGMAAAGKGPLACYLAACFATGSPAFGQFPLRKCRVGYLDFEGRTLSSERIRSHVRGLGLPVESLKDRLYHVDCDPECMLDLEWLRRRVEQLKIEVLIVDSYTSASVALGVEANSPAFAHLAAELGRLGIVVILVVHARKPSAGVRGERPSLADVSGHSSLGGYAQTALGVWNPDEDNRLLGRIACLRAPKRGFPTLEIQWEQIGSGSKERWIPHVRGLSDKKARRDATEDAKLGRVLTALTTMLLTNPAHPQSVSGLARNVGVQSRAVGAVMQLLLQAGLVRHLPDPLGKTGGTFLLDGDVAHDAEQVEMLRSLEIKCGELQLPEETTPSGPRKFKRPPSRGRR